MVVNATNARLVAQAVTFARQSDLRLVVKNTGHDFLGRNIGYGSLSIWTHHIKGIEWLDGWTPTGNDTVDGQSVVRYGSGTQWSEIYSEAYAHDKIVTGGAAGVGRSFNRLFGKLMSFRQLVQVEAGSWEEVMAVSATDTDLVLTM
jgi:hypothetical protein